MPAARLREDVALRCLTSAIKVFVRLWRESPRVMRDIFTRARQSRLLLLGDVAPSVAHHRHHQNHQIRSDIHKFVRGRIGEYFSRNSWLASACGILIINWQPTLNAD